MSLLCSHCLRSGLPRRVTRAWIIESTRASDRSASRDVRGFGNDAGGYRAKASISIQRSDRTSSRISRFSTTAATRLALESIPNRVEVLTGPLGRLSKVLPPRQSTEITTRVGSNFSGMHSLKWITPPRNVVIVKKQNDAGALKAMQHVVRHIQSQYPDLNVLVEPDSYQELGALISSKILRFDPSNEQDRALLARKADIALTLGGDGSILHVSSLFDQGSVPPTLSFSMGTLGFLLPYHFGSFEKAFEDLVLKANVSLLFRMRIRQTLHNGSGAVICSDGSRCQEVHLMNEIALHRGREPHMTMIDAFVNGKHLTRAISDGLIVGTPTGSTAYSLSAGGPIVHPSVQSLLLTPICPRSLSFRPVLLPSDARVQLKVARASRSPADLSVDGRHFHVLQPGEHLCVAMSPYPIPCVQLPAVSGIGIAEPDEPSLLDVGAEVSPSSQSEDERGQDTWVRDINTLLRFNASFAGRGLLGGNGSYEDGDESSSGGRGSGKR